ncbi:MAG: GNAT family N-acetyltransferase [Planctomycetota bacterium]|nr:GNAT family N-acetyltransferase [Planctomycetota bacterium]MDA1164110.1 GNAT family N-acetyltransferase [Planctomycetota bacterium]
MTATTLQLEVSAATLQPPSDLSLEVRSSADRADVLRQWKALEQRIGHSGLTCSFDWTEAWLNAYGGLVPHTFLLARDSATETLQGICLVTEGVAQKDGPFSLRTLHVGPAGEPDADSVCVEYNRLLVAPEFESAFAGCIVDHLESRSGFDQWNLDGIATAQLAAFQQHAPELQLRVEPAYGFDFASARAESTDVLSQFRSATRRKVKLSMAAWYDIKVEWAATLDEAVDVFSEMVDLHQARWNAAGKPGSYSSQRFLAFHEELLTRLVPQGRMALVRIQSGSDTIGIVQLLIENRRALLYQCGRSIEDKTRSPGVVVDYLAMEECLRQGLDAYDFLAFATQHKRLLANMSTDIVWARKRHPRLKFVVLDQARRVRSWLRERRDKQ